MTSPSLAEAVVADLEAIRTRTPLVALQGDTRVAFTAPSLKERLSDHFGIEADLSLIPVPPTALAAQNLSVTELFPAP